MFSLFCVEVIVFCKCRAGSIVAVVVVGEIIDKGLLIIVLVIVILVVTCIHGECYIIIVNINNRSRYVLNLYTGTYLVSL